MVATRACSVSPDRWCAPHTLPSAWTSLSLFGAPLLTSDQLAGYNVQIVPDGLRLKRCKTFGRYTFKSSSCVPRQARERLRKACNTDDVEASWHVWSKEAEASLVRAHHTAGGPALAGPNSFMERGHLSLRTWRLGGGVRIESIALIMPMSLMLPTVGSSIIRRWPQHFGFAADSNRSVMSSKALRLMGLLMQGCLHSGTSGLQSRRWAPSAPLRRLNLGLIGPSLPSPPPLPRPPTVLNEFLLKVVHCRRTTRLQAWSNWIREDLSSHPYQWLRLDFVPPTPCLVCKHKDSPTGSGILFQPALVDAHFRTAWIPYFRRERHPVISPRAVFSNVWWATFLKRPLWICPFLRERSFVMWPWKKSTAGGLDGWAWNENKALSLSWFVGLAVVPRQIETAGKMAQGPP